MCANAVLEEFHISWYRLHECNIKLKYACSEITHFTCFFAGEVVTPLLLTLSRAAEEGTNTEQHLYREEEQCF